MAVRFFVFLLLSLLAATDAVQCPNNTLVHLSYNHSESMTGESNFTNAPVCTGDWSSSQCCHCEEDRLVCLSLDSAISYINNILVVESSSVNGFELTLGQWNTSTNLTLSASYYIHDLDQVGMTGLGAVTVYCADSAGLVFNATVSVTMQSISWWGCGPIATPTGELYQISVFCGLAFFDCAQVRLSSVHFNNFAGSAVVYDIRSLPHYKCGSDSCMVDQTAGEVFNCTVQDSSFTGNGKISNANGSDSNVYGGALSIYIGTATVNYISILNTQFISNQALFGGGLFYNHSHSLTCFYTELTVQDSSFVGNSAYSRGGAVYAEIDNGFFDNCTFMSNFASGVGGAVQYYLFNAIPCCNNTSKQVIFNSCTWSGNEGLTSAALDLHSESGTTNIDIVIIANNFTSNRVTNFYIFEQSACLMYITSVVMTFESITAVDNYGTVLCLDTSKISFKGSNYFSGNQGFQGGCVYVYISSELILLAGQMLTFVNNTALYGGAIYQDLLLSVSETCVFSFNATNWNPAQVSFISNTAFTNGDSVYFVNATPMCEHTFEKFFYSPDDSSQLSSSAQSIEFLPPVYTWYNDSDLEVINVFLGSKISLNLIVHDFFNHTTLSLANTYLQVRNYPLQPVPYTIVGSPAFTIENGTNDPNLAIAGPKIDQEGLSQYSLMLITANIQKSLGLFFLPCPFGLEYDDSTQQCICFEEDELVCEQESATVCIQESYWLGEINGTYVVALCSFGFCTAAYASCTECPVNGARAYCQLMGSESVCDGNRTGILCGECMEGYAPTFQSLHCVDDSTCSAKTTFYLLLINACFIVAIICLFIIVLKLDYRIGSGYVFGVFYFYSIVGHLLHPNVVKEPMLVIVAVLRGITQLNTVYLGYVKLCFSSSLSNIVQYALIYLNPLVVSIFVLAAVGFSRYCSRLLKFNDSTPVRAICLLIISSFATLTEVSFNIISPVSLDGNVSDLVRVNIQPSVVYLDPAKHLPWLILAFLIIIMIIIPFTFLLLLAPFLVRCINLNRIKPFLDEFQGCYKDQFRWMAGFYFLCRILYLGLVTSSGAGLKSLQYGIQLLSLCILALHVVLQPYKSGFLNLIDSIFLVNLMMLTLLFGQTANSVFEPVPEIRTVLTYILVLTPALYVLLLAMVAAVGKIANRYNRQSRFFRVLRMLSTRNWETDAIIISNHSRNSSKMDSEFRHYREPLLSILETTPEQTSRRTPPDTTSVELLFTDEVTLKTETILERPLLSTTESSMYQGNSDS